MSLSDFAARMRQQATGESGNDRPPRDPNAVYALRARILGVLIRDARQAAGLSPAACAEQIGVMEDVLLAWEFGRAVPSLPQIELLAAALDVPVSHFWGTQTLAERRESQSVDEAAYTALRDRLIGALLRAAREARGLSIEQVAEEAGLSPDVLTAYEFGQRPIPLPVLATLANACNVNLSYFLERNSRIGNALAAREDVERLRALPPELRHFAATPVNQAYLELAMRLSQMSSAELRAIAEAILNITL